MLSQLPVFHMPCLPWLLLQFLSLGPVEVWRYNGSGGGFEGPYDTSYPGWDPLGLTEDPDTLAELKVGRPARLPSVGT